MSSPSASADVTLPAATNTSDLVFRLTVTDSAGEAHSLYSAIRVLASGADGSAPSTVANSGSGTGTTPATGITPVTPPAPTASSGGGGGGASTLPGLAVLFVLLGFFRRGARFQKIAS